MILRCVAAAAAFLSLPVFASALFSPWLDGYEAGSETVGDVTLLARQIVDVYIGQAGGNASSDSDGGGTVGDFVALSFASPVTLPAAGGGGDAWIYLDGANATSSGYRSAQALQSK